MICRKILTHSKVRLNPHVVCTYGHSQPLSFQIKTLLSVKQSLGNAWEGRTHKHPFLRNFERKGAVSLFHSLLVWWWFSFYSEQNAQPHTQINALHSSCIAVLAFHSFRCLLLSLIFLPVTMCHNSNNNSNSNDEDDEHMTIQEVLEKLLHTFSHVSSNGGSNNNNNSCQGHSETNEESQGHSVDNLSGRFSFGALSSSFPVPCSSSLSPTQEALVDSRTPVKPWDQSPQLCYHDNDYIAQQHHHHQYIEQHKGQQQRLVRFQGTLFVPRSDPDLPPDNRSSRVSFSCSSSSSSSSLPAPFSSQPYRIRLDRHVCSVLPSIQEE